MKKISGRIKISAAPKGTLEFMAAARKQWGNSASSEKLLMSALAIVVSKHFMKWKLIERLMSPAPKVESGAEFSMQIDISKYDSKLMRFIMDIRDNRSAGSSVHYPNGGLLNILLNALDIVLNNTRERSRMISTIKARDHMLNKYRREAKRKSRALTGRGIRED